MHDEDEPTLRNIAGELTTPGYGERARARQRSTRTVWDLIFMPITFGCIGLCWIAFGKFFWWLHVLIYPADGARFKTWMGGSMTLAQFLMFLVPVFAAVPLGGIASNALLWLVPPARRASEEKAKGRKWATFRGAQMGLLKLALVLVPIAAASGIIGALLMGR